MKIPAKQFEFRHWKECFEELRVLIAAGYGDKDIRLVISNDPITSGYWVESTEENISPDVKVYNLEEAFKLERYLLYMTIPR